MANDQEAALAQPFHPPADLRWLALWREPVLEPELPIIDAHHHLFARPEWRYLFDELRTDLEVGHKVVATVYLQCREHYRNDGPDHLRPVGETEFVDRVAQLSTDGQHGPARACAAIVAFADLTLGAAVDEVLQAHLAASPTRMRGIRHGGAGDSDPAFARQGARPPDGLFRQSDFRAGFARLAPLGLSFDAWVYHPQLPDVIDLAQSFPGTSIVLNHVGGPLGIGGYATRREAEFERWRKAIRQLSACPNVVVKLGGLGMRHCGFGFRDAGRAPDSTQLANAWRPYIETCIEAFGSERCLFESNFPVDQYSCSYEVLWNAFKRLAAGASAGQKHDLFSGTAARVYRITDLGGGAATK